MDLMTLRNEDGTSTEVEIVVTFKIEELGDNDYVIYKENEKFFGAKYVENDGIVDLIVDLSDDEKNKLSEVFKKLCSGGIIQC